MFSVFEVWAYVFVYTDFFMCIKTNSIYGIYGMEYQLRAANDNDFLEKEEKTQKNIVTLNLYTYAHAIGTK